MKNVTKLLRWPHGRMCSQTFTVQNKLAAVAPKEIHHPSFLLSFGNWQKKTVDGTNLYMQKMLLKQKPSKHS